MKPVRCHFCHIAVTRYVGMRSAPCTDCGGALVHSCRGCCYVGRKDHTDPRPTPGFTPLEAWTEVSA